MYTRLSVNINKVALLRNSRKGNYPDLFRFAADCEDFGAEGITVHPRPDQRHIRYTDLPVLRRQVRTEFNIEGYPSPDFMDIVLDIRPDQCTLVPDGPDVLTSDSGWDTRAQSGLLSETIERLKSAGIRVSVFVDPDEDMVRGAAACGADRIELYTGDYAAQYAANPVRAVSPHVAAAAEAGRLHLGVNAGHDLNLDNLSFYKRHVPGLAEVSIGHAIVSDALYYGIQNTLQMYRRALEVPVF